MLTFKQYLTEEWHATFKQKYSNNNYDVFKNPSSKELKSIEGNYDVIRAIAHKDGNIYAWKDDTALHHHTIKNLGLNPDDCDHAYIQPKQKKLLISSFKHTTRSLLGKLQHPYLNSDHFKTTLRGYTTDYGEPD